LDFGILFGNNYCCFLFSSNFLGSQIALPSISILWQNLLAIQKLSSEFVVEVWNRCWDFTCFCFFEFSSGLVLFWLFKSLLAYTWIWSFLVLLGSNKGWFLIGPSVHVVLFSEYKRTAGSSGFASAWAFPGRWAC